MRLYSKEWVAAFNDAVAGVAAEEPGVSLRLLQVVEGSHEGTVRVGLVVDGAAVTMVREPPDGDFDVTISLRYDDAVALSRGELDPAQLLAAGRVRVRGDVSVLVAGQALLAAVVARAEPLSRRPSD